MTICVALLTLEEFTVIGEVLFPDDAVTLKEFTVTGEVLIPEATCTRKEYNPDMIITPLLELYNPDVMILSLLKADGGSMEGMGQGVLAGRAIGPPYVVMRTLFRGT
jgi:hypothetical protein